MVAGRAFRRGLHGYLLLASHLEGAPYLGEREKNTPQRHHAALLIFYSEVINFWFWFVKFTLHTVLGAVSHPPGPVVPGRFFS